MKRALVILFLSISVPLFAESFYIKDYQVDIQINPDTSFNVQEKILVHFTSAKHGLLRNIPVLEYGKPDIMIGGFHVLNRCFFVYSEMLIDETQKKKEGFEDLNISEDIAIAFGKKAKYAVVMDNLKIGSVFTEVDGDQEYIIRYKVYNVITDQTNFFRFYWNVIGNQWNTEINKVSYSITLPSEVEPGKGDMTVYTGYYGDKKKDATIGLNGNVISGHSLTKLYAKQGITVDIRFPLGYFTPARPGIVELVDSWLTTAFAVNPEYYYWFIAPAGILLILFVIWFFAGRDHVGTIVTQFFPPKGLNPAEAGMLINDKMDAHDILSLIYYWAVQKRLTIIKQADSFELKKISELKDPRSYEAKLFDGIFYSKKRVKVKDLGKELAGVMYEVRTGLKDAVDKRNFYTKGMNKVSAWLNGLWHLFFWTAMPLLLFNFEYQFFMRFPTIMPELALLSIPLFIGSIVLMFNSDKHPVFIIINKVFYFIGGSMLVSYIMQFFVMLYGSLITWPVVLSLFLCAYSFRAFKTIMLKKTKSGMKKFRELKGFAEFIARAEQDQLRRLVDERVDYFEMTLPYAIAFGMAGEWVKKFKGIQFTMPSWMTGSGVTKDYDIDMFWRDIETSWSFILNSYNEGVLSSGGGSSDSSWSSGGSDFSGSSGGDSGGSSGGGSGGGGGSSW